MMCRELIDRCNGHWSELVTYGVVAAYSALINNRIAQLLQPADCAVTVCCPAAILSNIHPATPRGIMNDQAVQSCCFVTVTVTGRRVQVGEAGNLTRDDTQFTGPGRLRAP